MTMMSDLSHDVLEAILSRVQRSSLRAVRSTCKLWNRLSKNRILCKAEARHEFLGFTLMEHNLYSMRFNLHGLGLNEDGEEFVDPSIKPIGNNILNQVEISKVFYCAGLLLCVTRNHSRKQLVVWNPYLGQTRWIQSGNVNRVGAKYVLGCDNSKNHKILRFFDRYKNYEIYDFKSNSWGLIDVIPEYTFRGSVSVDGNTYFMSLAIKVTNAFILCFDFTRERFGQILPLPFRSFDMDSWTLSSVREEKLAVLYEYSENTYVTVIEIWVTNKIEPNDAVSWSKFLRVDGEPPVGFGYQFDEANDSFFIDEAKKAAVVFRLDKLDTPTAYIIGDNHRYLETVNLEDAVNAQESLETGEGVYYYSPLMLCSSHYVPSLVQIKKVTGRQRKEKKRKKNKRKDEKRKRTKCNTTSAREN